MTARLRQFISLVSLFLLAACGAADKDLAGPVEPIGAFKLGYSIVVADQVQKVDPSRDVSPDEWEAALKKALDRRFSRYQGDQFYHIAVFVEGYSVAVTGIPLVLTPQSVLIVGATIWDDAKGGKINQEPERITVLERASEKTFIGSGATQTKAEQVKALADNTARLIEVWMRKNPDWFAPRGGAPATAPTSAVPTGG